MGHSNLQGIVVYRVWHDTEGYTETERPFETLDELFHLCLQIHGENPPRVDRIVLRGSSDKGDELTAVFSFQSMTAGDGTLLA